MSFDKIFNTLINQLENFYNNDIYISLIPFDYNSKFISCGF